MARKKATKSRVHKTRRKAIPAPMEFNPALEKFEPKFPLNPADHTTYPQAPPRRKDKGNWKWIIAIIILLLLILAFFLYIFRSPAPVINTPNIPEAFLSLFRSNPNSIN